MDIIVILLKISVIILCTFYLYSDLSLNIETLYINTMKLCIYLNRLLVKI